MKVSKTYSQMKCMMFKAHYGFSHKGPGVAKSSVLPPMICRCRRELRENPVHAHIT